MTPGRCNGIPVVWCSDGTSVGTKLVANLIPGIQGSDPISLTRSGNTLFFRAADGILGDRLWLASLA